MQPLVDHSCYRISRYVPLDPVIDCPYLAEVLLEKKITTRDRRQIEIYGGAIDFFMRAEFYESLRVVYDTFLADYIELLLFENLE